MLTNVILTGLFILSIYTKSLLQRPFEYTYIIKKTGHFVQSLKHFPNWKHKLWRGRKGKDGHRQCLINSRGLLLSLTKSDRRWGLIGKNKKERKKETVPIIICNRSSKDSS